MAASILYAPTWDRTDNQYFVSVNSARDEITIVESIYDDKQWTTKNMAQMADFEAIQCLTYDPMNFGQVAVGLSDGSVLQCKPGTESHSIRFVPRQYRSCNAISINKNGLIAAGLEKVRGDNSLLIWDVGSNSKNSNGESIIRTPLYSSVPNENVYTVEFLPHNPNLLICASNKILREFDIRTGVPSFQCAGKGAHNVYANPIDDNYFVTLFDDGGFAFWDRRLIAPGISTSEPPLIFPRLLNATDSGRTSQKYGSCFRFSKTRVGEFAMLQNGDTLRRWQIGLVPPVGDQARSVSSINLKQEYISKDHDCLFVSCVLDSKTNYDKVVSFDYAPDLFFRAKPDFMCIRQSGQIFRMSIMESPDAVSFDPYNSMTVADPNGLVSFGPSENETQDKSNLKKTEHETSDDERIEKAAQTLISVLVDDDEESEDELEDDKLLQFEEGLLSYEQVLRTDISVIMRNRALEGYGISCNKSFDVIARSKQEKHKVSLRYLWKWLDMSVKIRERRVMYQGTLDLGLEGVAGLWEGVPGFDKQKRIVLKTPNRPQITPRDYNEAISNVNKAIGKHIFVSSKVSGTQFGSQRQLCLRVAGWDFELHELESKLQELEKRGRHEQAAGWALFHGDVERCIKSLASSRKERLRLMSTAVAGYQAYKNDATNNIWREQCQRLATDLDNPYLRAIFAFITYGSWDDVLDEQSLPLAEKLGIALRFLPDEKLTKFIKTCTDRTVKNGDLEGIILTGLTPPLVDLLQAYVNKSSDIQTAALVISYGCPRYFHDNRAQHWIEDYRVLLNRWKLFHLRARFDVARNKLSKASTGQQMNKSVPAQIFLKCFQCSGVIGRPLPHKQAQDLFSAQSQTSEHDGASKNPSVRCPYCNAPLPRCAVCLLPLGSCTPVKETAGHDNLAMFDQWPTFCLSCNHGLHAGHARQWFAKHNICPVPDCNCLCNEREVMNSVI